LSSDENFVYEEFAKTEKEEMKAYFKPK